MFCSVCGAKLSENAQFCSACGSQVAVAQPQMSPKNASALKNKNFDIFFALTVIISSIMLIAMLSLPLFEFQSRYHNKIDYDPYVFSLFGTNYMWNEIPRAEILTTMNTLFVFIAVSIIAVNIFSFAKKYVLQTISAVVNSTLLIFCISKVNNIWETNTYQKTSYLYICDNLEGTNISLICSFLLIIVSIIAAVKMMRQEVQLIEDDTQEAFEEISLDFNIINAIQNKVTRFTDDELLENMKELDELLSSGPTGMTEQTFEEYRVARVTCEARYFEEYKCKPIMCVNCGAYLFPNQKFCGKCGTNVPQSE